MQKTGSITCSGGVIHTELLAQSRLAIADENSAFKIVDLKHNNNTLFGLKLKTAITTTTQHNISFSQDGKLLAFSEIGKPIVRVLNVEQKSILYSFSKHKDGVESLCISPNGRYLATGGIDGKVFLFNLINGRYLARFSSHPDYISQLRFSPNGEYLTSTGYEGGLIATNTHTYTLAKKIRPHKNRVAYFIYGKKDEIISGGVDGELVILNYKTKAINKRFMSPHGQISALCLTKDAKYLFVAGIQNYIAVYETDQYSELSSHYIKLESKANSLEISEDGQSLLIGCENSKLEVYKLFDTKELTTKLQEKDYKAAQEIIKKDPLIENTKEKQMFDTIWEKSFNAAMKLLIKDDEPRASALLTPFFNVSKLSSLAIKLLDNFKHYKKLKELISGKKLSAAYSLVQQHPYLEETPVYQKLEQHWESSFARAKKIMLTKNDAPTAKIALQDFMNVPSKTPIIQILLNDINTFKSLISAIKKKDFQSILAIIAAHQYLKNTSEYQEAMQMAEKIIDIANAKLREHDYHSVQVYAKLILSVPHLQEQAQSLKDYAYGAALFMHAYNEADKFACLTLLDKYPFLEEMKEAEEIEEMWREMMLVCEEASYNGNIKVIKETLGDFIKIESRSEIIASYLKTSYLFQVKKFATSKQLSNPDVVKGLKLYLHLFNYDQDIGLLIKKLRQVRGFDFDLGDNEMEEKDECNWLEVCGSNPANLIFSKSKQ